MSEQHLDPPQEPEHREVQPNASDTQLRSEKVKEHFFASDRSHQAYAPKPWQQRPSSPGLKWHKHYDTPESRKTGRVLVIDYVKKSHSKEGMRKVATQEFDSITELRKIYTNPERGSEAVLRVFHVQNATWATHFLLRKFNISARDDLVGTDFGHYVKTEHRERRGKPLLTGRSWKTVHDPWRGVNKTSFGLDYLKPYRVRQLELQGRRDAIGTMMELNCYDDDGSPGSSWDVYAQRLVNFFQVSCLVDRLDRFQSCYVQHKVSSVPAAYHSVGNVENPYRATGVRADPREYFPRLENLDNGNVIILFDNSCSGSIDDTIITAREQCESRVIIPLATCPRRGCAYSGSPIVAPTAILPCLRLTGYLQRRSNGLGVYEDHFS